MACYNVCEFDLHVMPCSTFAKRSVTFNGRKSVLRGVVYASNNSDNFAAVLQPAATGLKGRIMRRRAADAHDDR